jgi:hypothetical protein
MDYECALPVASLSSTSPSCAMATLYLASTASLASAVHRHLLICPSDCSFALALLLLAVAAFAKAAAVPIVPLKLRNAPTWPFFNIVRHRPSLFARAVRPALQQTEHN